MSSRWKKITDTNMHFLNMNQMRQRMFRIGSQIPSPAYVNIMKSGFLQAVGFAQFIQCSEIILECAQCYDPRSQMSKTPNSTIIAYLAEVFGIPSGADIKDITKDEYEDRYKKKMDACKTMVNKEWMIEPRPHHSKAPKTLMCTDFKEEYSDLVCLLNRVMGMSQGAIYYGWMFYFIQDCLKGTLINWSRIISDNLDFQLRNAEQSKSFAMTSYLVYCLHDLLHTKD